MSVVGIGTDIVDINRIAAMSDAMIEKLARRVLTADEYQRFAMHKQPHRFLAKRWAGKEAAAKALGTGIAAGISFQHFIITSTPTGKPELELTEQALAHAQQLSATNWHISLSDEADYATAFVVLSR